MSELYRIKDEETGLYYVGTANYFSGSFSERGKLYKSMRDVKLAKSCQADFAFKGKKLVVETLEYVIKGEAPL